MKHDISFSIQNIQFDDLETAKLWAWKHQEHRRNLSAFMRGELAARFKDKIVEKAKMRQREAGGVKPGKALLSISTEAVNTRSELAEIAGVSPSTIRQIGYISEHADEETKDKLRRGEKGTSINGEYKRLKAEAQGVEPTGDDTAVPEIEDDTVQNSSDEAKPSPPCPNKDQKYYPKTTLKFITHETPRPLLVNLFEIFPKEYVEELFPMGMEMLLENRGKDVVKKIMAELNEKYGPKKLR